MIDKNAFSLQAVINALREFGVAEKDNFDTSDLFDRKNARQVSPHL